MKNFIAAACAVSLLSLASAANASLVTWEFKGHITAAGASTAYQAGDSFNAWVTFDTAAAELVTPNVSRHSLDISSLKISYQIGTTAWQNFDSSAGGLIYVRDNQANPVAGASNLVDGLTFQLGSAALILRWNDLSTLDYSQHSLPSTPPALTNLAANSFQDNNGTFNGAIDSVTAVPEPSSYALLLAGLGVVGAVARRRSAKHVG